MSAVALLQSALEAHRAGRLAQAEQAYRAVLASESDNPDALHLLGVLLMQTGHLREGRISIEKALQRNPTHPEYHLSLGEARQREGDVAGAIRAYRAALSINAAFASAHNNLGNALRLVGDFEGALAAFQSAHQLRPDDASFAYNLGTTLHQMGKSAAAIPPLELACRLRPNSVDAAVNLANALLAAGQTDAALQRYKGAAALAPNDADIWSNLGNAAKLAGDRDAALEHYRTAVKLNPALGPAQANLANELADRSELDAAVAHYRAAVQAGNIGAAAHSNLLLLLHYVHGVTAPEIAAEHRRWAEQHAGFLARDILPHRNNRQLDRKLRVGFVSPDFREHPVARFLLPIWAGHDHDQFQFFAYSDTRQPDLITAQLRGQRVEWRDTVHLSDVQLAQLIRDDAIDLLLDLAGHTSQNRLLVFARTPAPVQLSYLGYPDTTGLSAINYRIVDALSDPPGLTDPFCAEKLCRLPETAWCYRPPAEVPEPEVFAARADGRFWFGSFNNLGKISSSTVALWAQVLAAVPRSGLLLKPRKRSDPALLEKVRGRFAEAGIAPDRVQFSPRTPTQTEHFACYHRINVALDTFPYHGTTTTCDALWMGVPVVTLAGDTHHSRVGVSLLTNSGRPEWVARSAEEFVKIAVELAASPARLAELRATLRAQVASSPLRNETKFTRSMESLYREVWQAWCKANP